jgi:hypothetical protein
VLSYDESLEKTEVLCRENDDILFDILGGETDKGSSGSRSGFCRGREISVSRGSPVDKPADRF